MFDFSLFFNAFLIDFGPPNGTLKSSQNLSKIRLGRPKAPQGRQRQPRGLQGAILRPPGGLQVAIFELFGNYFWTMGPFTNIPLNHNASNKGGRRHGDGALKIIWNGMTNA